MSSVTYKLSKRADQDGRCQIIVWLKWARGFEPQVKSGVYIDPKNFEQKGASGGYITGDIKVPNRSKLNYVQVREASKAKNDLQLFTSKLVRVCEVVTDDLRTKDFISKAVAVFPHIELEQITMRSLCALIEQMDKSQVRKSFVQYAEVYLQEKNFAYSQVRNFRSMIRCLNRWEGFRRYCGDKFTIDIDTLTADDIQDFREYMSEEHVLQHEYKALYEELFANYPVEIQEKHKNAKVIEKGENTRIKLLKRFKAFWLWMIEKGHTNNNPFKGVKMGEAIYGIPYYLTIDERNQLADYDLSERPALAVQRDIFVFQCLIGCRVSDLYKLTEANVTNGILEYVPVKTKDHIKQVKPRIPLTERAKALIERYKGADRHGRLFPFISTQRYNDAIKDALRLCGIDRNVQVRNSLTGETEIKPIYEVASSHMARRTFVGTTYSKVQDPNIISKMSGHVEGSRAFARYRAIDDDILKEVILKIDDEVILKIDDEQRNEENEKAELLKKLAQLSAEELKKLVQ